MQYEREMSKRSLFPSTVLPAPLQAGIGDGLQGSGPHADIVAFKDAAVQLGKRTGGRQATFQMEPGEFVAILGPTGAGKPILLRLWLALLPPIKGSAAVPG